MPAAASFPLEAYTIKYELAWDIAFQQMDATLRNSVTTVDANGERVHGNILDAVEMVDVTTRAGDTVVSDMGEDSWNFFPNPAANALRFDQWDEAYLGVISQPNSEVAQSQAYASNRFIDNIIVAAVTGTAYRGKNGTTAVTLPAAQTIAVDYTGDGVSPANTGLSWMKISQAQYLLSTAEVPTTERYLVTNAAGLKALIQDIITNHSAEVSSIRDLGRSLLQNGLMDFTFIQTERIAVSASDIASNLAYHKSAIKFGMWTDRRTLMDRLPTKNQALQIYTSVNVGATRAKDTGVVEILCDQSPA